MIATHSESGSAWLVKPSLCNRLTEKSMDLMLSESPAVRFSKKVSPVSDLSKEWNSKLCKGYWASSSFLVYRLTPEARGLVKCKCQSWMNRALKVGFFQSVQHWFNSTSFEINGIFTTGFNRNRIRPTLNFSENSTLLHSVKFSCYSGWDLMGSSHSGPALI